MRNGSEKIIIVILPHVSKLHTTRLIPLNMQITFFTYIFTDHQHEMVHGIHLKDKIRRRLPELAEIIEPDYGLLDELLSKDILDDMQIADVQSSGPSIEEQNMRLLHRFIDKSDDVCQPFLTALESMLQHHVVNFILYEEQR